jgi:hypothetical protein
MGGTVVTVGFPNLGLPGFAPKFARGEIANTEIVRGIFVRGIKRLP